MLKRTTLLVVLASLFLGSCDMNRNATKDHNIDNANQAELEDKVKEEVAIQLNEGQKWRVNAEMLPHIQNCEAAYLNFTGNDYSKLAEEMMSHTNQLIQNCTMTGASHDELHKWLHPHIEYVKLLGNEDKDEAEEAFEDLEASFALYHTYFE